MAQTTLFDGDLLRVGDRMYDVVFGFGVVEELRSSGDIVLRFGADRSMVFTPTGTNRRFPHRTLYWRNPVVIVPVKSEARWNLMLQLMQQVHSVVRSWSGQ